MMINGALEKLGLWNKGEGSLPMKKGDEVVWLTGERVRPWEHKIHLNSSEDTLMNFDYKYSIRNETKDITVWEREPSRRCNI
jgi:hypothetical protein